MNYQRGLYFVEKVVEKAADEELVAHAWDMWIGHINNPFVEKKITWEKFISEIKKPRKDSPRISKEEIIAQAEIIRKKHMSMMKIDDTK